MRACRSTELVCAMTAVGLSMLCRQTPHLEVSREGEEGVSGRREGGGCARAPGQCPRPLFQHHHMQATAAGCLNLAICATLTFLDGCNMALGLWNSQS
jgi:hypothetical protein